jgi:F0F1-type ATP synthase assembly protein I
LKPDFLPRKYREFLGLGAEIAASLAIPMIAGFYIDKYFNSSPAGILAGVFLGLILFFMTILRIAKKLNSNGDD